MKVPFIDMARQYSQIKEEVDLAMHEAIENSSFILGQYVKKFEEGFSRFCGTNFAVGLNSGTAAIFIALKALGIGQGDEVITTPFSFIASSSAITHAGAKPVFADIEEDTYNISPKCILDAITKKTRAIIVVHLYGQCADMDAINKIAKKYNLYVIEDACQAHGAEYNGKKAGSMGDVGCFSFYPTKNLGCLGDGGLITTNNSEVYALAKMLRDHGQSKKYEHEIIGYNERLDSIQAAVLNIKLEYLEKWNQMRRKNVQLYNKYLDGTGVKCPVEKGYAKHVYNVYAIRAKSRLKLAEYLRSKNIETAIHYPILIPYQKAYAFLNIKQGLFPVAEGVAKDILALPIYPEIEESEIKYVAECIKEFEAIPN